MLYEMTFQVEAFPDTVESSTGGRTKPFQRSGMDCQNHFFYQLDGFFYPPRRYPLECVFTLVGKAHKGSS